jgi:hypothetical protein
VSTRAIYVLIGILVLASIAVGIVYSALTKEVGDAFSVASFTMTAAAVVVAVSAAGEWFGLEAPDSFGESGVRVHERVIGRVLLDHEQSSRGKKHEDV